MLLSHLFDGPPLCSVCRAVPANHAGFRCRVSLDVLRRESAASVEENCRGKTAVVCRSLPSGGDPSENHEQPHSVGVASSELFAGLDAFEEIKVHFVVHMWRARGVSDSHRSVGLSAHQLPSDSATEPPLTLAFKRSSDSIRTCHRTDGDV